MIKKQTSTVATDQRILATSIANFLSRLEGVDMNTLKFDEIVSHYVLLASDCFLQRKEDGRDSSAQPKAMIALMATDTSIPIIVTKAGDEMPLAAITNDDIAELPSTIVIILPSLRSLLFDPNLISFSTFASYLIDLGGFLANAESVPRRFSISIRSVSTAEWFLLTEGAESLLASEPLDSDNPEVESVASALQMIATSALVYLYDDGESSAVLTRFVNARVNFDQAVKFSLLNI